ncbi:MAG: hypothetical protein E6K81_10915 [Candidatus Eisenbacteria bacterium]|uniref:Glycosyltransferase RgtA/B/C/D-like domain-containing protein n=1 Tax=Eiseniibacteriota bacterium TaxID=2212470 RepID=A0A538U5Y6_UNCEI|nr:MAG: hypothetical protein E6K81_10915 [Candidatus Eisenbacteria bacterium]
MAEARARAGEASASRPLTGAVILVFTLASAFAINPYAYGGGDNRIAIPFLKAFADPGLYPGDYLLAQRPYYYTYLWNALGLIHRVLSVGLPALFFGLYLAALFLTFLGVHRLSTTLFRSPAAAALALVLLAFPRMTLGGIPIVDPMLTTRAVATPIVLFAIVQHLEGRIGRAFLLLGLAYLVHPITTHFGLAMLVGATLVRPRRDGLRRLGTGLLGFLAVASPLLLWRLQHAPPSLHLGLADPEWVHALRARSSHHLFPFSWGWTALVHALAAIALLVLTTRGWGAADERHRQVRAAALALVVLGVAGTVFSELEPLGLALLTQPLRAFAFVEFLVMVLVAGHFVAGADRPLRRADALVAALAALWAAGGPRTYALPMIEAVVVVIAVIGLRRAGWGVGGAGRSVAATTALIALAASACVVDDALLGAGSTFSITGLDPPLHRDIGRWARTHTDRRDGFIVPPFEPGEFRVEGERTLYADSEDGTLMNFDPAFGREWSRRMRNLRAPDPASGQGDFCGLSVPDLVAIAREMALPGRRVFVVWPCSGRPLALPLRYRNAAYRVYEMPGDAATSR